jgi:methionyl aminopeptidase
MDELQDLLTPVLYQQNPFRVLGHSIAVSTREIVKRESSRHQKVRLGLEVDGDSTSPFRPIVPSTEQEREAALKRLRTPRDRFLAELFWFWPSPNISDPALCALEAEDIDAAIELWGAEVDKPDQRVAARHNLAVLHHLLGLEGETALVKGRQGGISQAGVEENFQRALDHWHKLLLDSDFRFAIQAHAEALKDEKLTATFVHDVLKALPAGLLRINARLVVSYSELSDFPEAQRHVRLLQNAPFDPAARDAAIRHALGFLEKRINQVRDAARSKWTGTPHQGNAHVRALHVACMQPLVAANTLLGRRTNGLKVDASPYAAVGDALHDTVADAMLEGSSVYSGKTNDWSDGLELLELAQKVAVSEAMQSRLQDRIKTYRKNAEMGHGWCAPGYWELPDAAIKTLEAVRELADRGEYDAALVTLLQLDASSIGRPLRWAAAQCLSISAVDSYNTSSGDAAKQKVLPSVLQRVLLASEIDPNHPYALMCLRILKDNAKHWHISIPHTAALRDQLYPQHRRESMIEVTLPAHPAEQICFFCGRNPPASGCDIEAPGWKTTKGQWLLGPHTTVALGRIRVPRCRACSEAHRELPEKQADWDREVAHFFNFLPLRRESAQRPTTMTRLADWASSLGAVVCFAVGFGARDNRTGITFSGLETILAANIHLQPAWVDAALPPTTGLLAGVMLMLALTKAARMQRRRKQVGLEADVQRFWAARPEPRLPEGVKPIDTGRDFPNLTELQLDGWTFEYSTSASELTVRSENQAAEAQRKAEKAAAERQEEERPAAEARLKGEAARRINIYAPEDFAGMRAAGRLAAETLDLIVPHVQPGITTAALDRLCHEFILDHGATPAILNYGGFPKSICTSINHVACHGIPSERRLEEGDILNINAAVILNGWHGKTSRMFVAGTPSPRACKLLDITYEALVRSVRAVRPSATLGDIGYVIQAFVEGQQFSVVRDFCGSGIGRQLHEPPNVLNFGRPGEGPVLRPGMFFSIQPIVNAGRPEVKVLDDGWTAITRDRSLSAEFQHMVGVTEDGCEVFTYSPAGLHKPPYTSMGER